MKDQPEEKPKPEKKAPVTISELYLRNREEMPACTSEFQYFMRLRESIIIGASMLDLDDPLKKRANDALNDPENITVKDDMKYLDSRGIYACSSGYGTTGKITVRPEELEQAKATLRDQHARDIIMRISGLDREINDALLIQKKIRMHTMAERIEREMEF